MEKELPEKKKKTMRRRWNAFVGWVLYYPLGGVEKLREKAWKSAYRELKSISAGVYHEYLVRNAVKALDKQVDSWLRSTGQKPPTLNDKLDRILKAITAWRKETDKE